MWRWTVIGCAAAWLATGTTVGEDPQLNLFEWIQRAPIVLHGTSLGEDGKVVELRVAETLRGAPAPGAVIDIDVRTANRERDRLLDARALRLDAGTDYLVLLEAVDREAPTPPLYRLVRGVHGARTLPPEGREALLAALRRFVAIQALGSEAAAWAEFEELLGDTDPLLVRTALEQYLKFRRGSPEVLPDLRALLDHPAAELRELAARLVGQILAGPAALGGEAGEDELRSALVARARRDASVTVRVAATRALGAIPGDAVAEVLREIAESDPEQDVRYAAEVLLLERDRAQLRD